MKMLPVVIICGGLATRLRPLTETIPKSLLDVNGAPFIAHQLQLLRKNNIKEVVISAGFLGEQIEAYVGDGSRFDLNVKYCYDGETLLGTGGAIVNSLALLPDNFFVINGDSYLPCDYQAVQEAFFKHEKLALMTVFNNADQWDKSNVEFENNRIVTYDKKNRTPKMLYIDYGLAVFNKLAFQHYTQGTTFDLSEVYQALIQNNQLAACEVKERFYENGSFAGLADLQAYLLMNKLKVD